MNTRRFTGDEAREGRITDQPSETISPRVAFADRLRALGADPVTVQEVYDTWDDPGLDMTPAEWEVRRAELLSIADVDLRRMILNGDLVTAAGTVRLTDEARAEYAERTAGPTASGGPAVATGDEPPDDATVTEVREWVGDDPERARIALEAEEDRGDAARSTLVAYLQRVVDTDEG